MTGRGLLLLIVILAVSGCTRVHTVAQGMRHPWTQPHVLRVADIADPDKFNPLLSGMDLVEDLSSLTFSYLVIADGNGKLIGDLATEVPSLQNGGISRDGRTYTYHLHRDVKWHDRAAFTSHDVKFTWQAVVNPDNNVLHREGYDRVASIDTPNNYTLVVHLKVRSGCPCEDLSCSRSAHSPNDSIHSAVRAAPPSGPQRRAERIFRRSHHRSLVERLAMGHLTGPEVTLRLVMLSVLMQGLDVMLSSVEATHFDDNALRQAQGDMGFRVMLSGVEAAHFDDNPSTSLG